MEILLIENDLDEARAAIQVLDHGNVRCRVTLVRDGEEALAFIRRQGIFAKAPRPDLILLDLNLPKRSGGEVFEELQCDGDFNTIPIVVMSTQKECETIPGIDHYAVLEFMPKPLEAERFVSMVKALHYSLLTELVAASMV